MERFIIDIAIIFVVYIAGYKMGYKACFDYIKEEFRKHKEKNNND